MTGIPPVEVRSIRTCFGGDCMLFAWDDCSIDKMQECGRPSNLTAPCKYHMTLQEYETILNQHNAGELPEGVISAIREYLDGPADCSEYEAGKRAGLQFVLDLPGILNRQQPRQEGQ